MEKNEKKKRPWRPGNGARHDGPALLRRAGAASVSLAGCEESGLSGRRGVTEDRGTRACPK